MTSTEQADAASAEYKARFGAEPDFRYYLRAGNLSRFLGIIRKAIETNTPLPDPDADIPAGCLT